ncbi:MAG: ParB N-terminal domain-containing protein [Planctomycetota bacterium]
MPPGLFRKLVEHLRNTSQYPPIIVRPLPTGDPDEPSYQILDGHHRAAALRELGHTQAQCSVWQADDEQALILLATLNRLQGEDDPAKRGLLVSKLSEQIELPRLAELLPEDTDRLERLKQLCQPPQPLKDLRPVSDLPVAVHFFLKPAERSRLEARLKEHGGLREQALLTLLQIEPGDD